MPDADPTRTIPPVRKPDVPDPPVDAAADPTEPRTVRYWTETLGVSEEQLHMAVEHAGVSAREVRRYLGGEN
ncbi:MAG: DUF3606 domain-containing protein [Caulobacter sp.]